MNSVFSTFLILLTSAGLASAKPKVKENWSYYEVRGNSIGQLQSQLKSKGPKGFWAYTSWYVRWSGACAVSVEIRYTMPKLIKNDAMPASVLSIWNKMYAALEKHERNHGQHGINAAREIERNGCRNGKAIIRKWAEQDRIYDRKTQHGKTEGIRFQ